MKLQVRDKKTYLKTLKKEEIFHALNKCERSSKVVVDRARVRCTCCNDQVSHVFVYSRGINYTEQMGKELLNHKDTVFKNNFSHCTNTKDGQCKINILNDVWCEPDTNTEIGDGYRIDENVSYMICITGIGLIYISDSGQTNQRMEDRLDEELLDLFINEEAFLEMGWESYEIKDSNGNIIERLCIFDEYGDDALEKMKNYMMEYDLVNAISIKMFLASIRHESGGGKIELEQGSNQYFQGMSSYSKNVRGAGLMQVTGATQKDFLIFKYGQLPNSDPNKKIIEGYVKGYVDRLNSDGTVNTAYDNPHIDPGNNLTVAEYVAREYGIESAIWYWTTYQKLGYTEGAMKGQTESINDLVIRHTNHNQYNLFAVTQMVVNGCNYGAYALDRFCTADKNCEIKMRPPTGCGGNHSMITDYCFYLEENPGSNGGDIYRHDYGPNGWLDRQNAYSMANEYFLKQEGGY